MAKKIFLMSYDDGVIQDRRFIQLLHRYHLKATFNLNSGSLGNKNNINECEVKDLYESHEVACHTVNHPDLCELSEQDILDEVIQDQNCLSKLVGYEVKGMAYPFGTYNKNTLDTLKLTSIQYSRTIKDTLGFDIPENPLEFHPTCHHNNESLMKLLETFFTSTSDVPQVFTLWGHTYEFDTEEKWNYIESVMEKVAAQSNVQSMTMIDFVQSYMKQEIC